MRQMRPFNFLPDGPLLNKPSDRVKTIYLHIGCMKTGSTAIQRVLASNRKALETLGYCFPVTGVKAGNYLAFSLLDSVPPFLHNRLSISSEVLYRQLVDEIDSSRSQSFIISSEAYYLISTDLFLGKIGVLRLSEHLRRLRKQYSIKIVVYVRRQDDYAESLYNQFVKTHNFWGLYSDDIDQFIVQKFEMLDYTKILGRWSEVFEGADVIVREYVKGETDSIADFCCLTGIPMEDLKISHDVDHNSALNKKGLELMLMLNRTGINKRTAAINSELTELVNSLQSGGGRRFSLLTKAQRTKLMSGLRESNDILWSKYMGTKNPWVTVSDAPHDTDADVTMDELVQLFSILWNRYVEMRYNSKDK